MNLQTVATAFKDLLADWATANGVQVYDYVPESMNPPCVAVYPQRFPFDTSAPATFILWCVTGTVEMEGSQTRLMGWLSDTGPESICTLIDANHSLSGTVSSVLPLEVRAYGLTPVQEGRPRLLQAELVCEVLR